MKKNSSSLIESSQEKYYLSKFLIHGISPKALSWNDTSSQYLRFNYLSQLFKYEINSNFSVHEVGCGLGHYYNYLRESLIVCDYSGSDIVPQFINYCQKNIPNSPFYLQSIVDNFENLKKTIGGRDYYILSGTFNTKDNNSINHWEKFVYAGIANMFSLSKKGVAFNFLTSHSDYFDNKLYYANPTKIFSWCTKNLSRFINISHDQPLYEFTVYVYKDKYIKSLYPKFQKYFKV